MTPDSLEPTTSLAPSTSVPIADLPTGLPRGLTLDDALRVAAALDAAHAESTRFVYAHTWRVWERWCTSRGVPATPAEPAALAAWCSVRVDREELVNCGRSGCREALGSANAVPTRPLCR